PQIAVLAAAAAKPVSYDLNYRATLTTPPEARAMLEAVAPHLELFVVAERDARAVLGFTEEAERLAEAIAARYGVPLVALTRPPGEGAGRPLVGAWRAPLRPALSRRDCRSDRRRRLVCRRADSRSARRRSRSGDPARRLCRR